MEKGHRILIVDDEPEINDLIYRKILENEGFTNVEIHSSIDGLMKALQQSMNPEQPPVDLILMDVIMPEQDGIQGIQEVKRYEMYRDIPILMLTAIHDKQLLKQAFEAGAMDYITKPVDPVELVARVSSALRLKQDIDRRKAWEQELLGLTRGLMESNSKLEQATFVDPVTGLLNRKAFDKRLQEDWIHCYVQNAPITLMLVEVDEFRAYNEQKGAVQGDDCLRAVAEIMRLHDRDRVFCSRFGGAMFALLFPGYDQETAKQDAEAIHKQVRELELPHAGLSEGFVKVTIGIATVDPANEPGPESLLQQTDLEIAHARVS
ncbi:MAG TPA: diguanylate cyclase [Candidatus Obscuribacterales bacterium]